MPDDLVAVFTDPDLAAAALGRLSAMDVSGARVISPAPYPAVHLTGRPGPWRYLGAIALVGGLTGLGAATALQVITSRSLNIIVGGKPIVSWPAFGVVMFELTLLFVAVTIGAAVVAQQRYGLLLADVDPLHGGAEAFLTFSNVLVMLGFLRRDPQR